MPSTHRPPPQKSSRARVETRLSSQLLRLFMLSTLYLVRSSRTTLFMGYVSVNHTFVKVDNHAYRETSSDIPNQPFILPFDPHNRTISGAYGIKVYKNAQLYYMSSLRDRLHCRSQVIARKRFKTLQGKSKIHILNRVPESAYVRINVNGMHIGGEAYHEVIVEGASHEVEWAFVSRGNCLTSIFSNGRGYEGFMQLAVWSTLNQPERPKPVPVQQNQSRMLSRVYAKKPIPPSKSATTSAGHISFLPFALPAFRGGNSIKDSKFAPGELGSTGALFLVPSNHRHCFLENALR